MTKKIKADNRQRPQRLLALDILRGITIAGMILVNNPGSWGNIYAPLRHASWHGLTPTDLVFPFFMFIMGVSTYFSLKKFDFKFSGKAVVKILVRTLVIFFIGWFLAWFSLTLRGLIANGQSVYEAMFTNFGSLRFLGVLPRLAICYGCGSIIALLCQGRQRYVATIVVVFLVIYTVLLLIAHGLEFDSNNIIAVVDRAVLGESHMYADTIDGITLKFDPEGFLSTLPSIAHMMIGFLIGGMILHVKDNTLRINNLFITGAILTFVGFLLAYGLPINKKIWSPTFVMTTCGLACSLLGLLIWIIDIKGYKKWCRFFEAFGINPLFMFVLGSLVSTLIGLIRIPYSGSQSGMISIKSWIYDIFLKETCHFDATFASLVFALSFVVFIWIFGYILYKNKIYIKI